MSQTKQLAERLNAVAAELAAIARELASDKKEAIFPDTAKQRIQLGLCLNCTRTKEEITQLRRGLCPACYQKSNRMLLKNPLLESDLITKGLLAPSGFDPQAAQTPLDEMIRTAWDKANADVAAAEETIKKRGKRKDG
jgi:hypothetical protein